MRTILKVMIVMLCITLFLWVVGQAPERTYRYVDILGREGIADTCYEIKGGLVCYTHDGKRISVAEYELID